MSLEFKADRYSKLIHLVKQYPILYDDQENVISDSSRLRLHQKKIKDSWIQVASQLGISSGECKRRWKHLREVHSNISKINADKRENFTKKWHFWKAMDFLNVRNPKEPETQNTNIEEMQLEENGVVYAVLNTDPQNKETETSQLQYIEIDENQEYYFVDDSNSNEQFEEVGSQETSSQNSNDVIMDSPEFGKYVILNSQNEKKNAPSIKYQSQYKFHNEEIQNEEENDSNIVEDQSQYKNHTVVEQDILVTENLTISVKKKFNTLPVIMEENSEENKLPEKRTEKRNREESIDDFFEEVAQKVLKMSPRAQVEAKMEVLRIISIAEIRSSLTRNVK